MKAKVRKIGIIVLGWLLILAGLILSLPLVPGPGVLVILIGLWVLSSEQHWAQRLVERIERRFPKFTSMMHEARAKAAGWFRRHPEAQAKPPCSGSTDVHETVSR